MRDFAKVAPSFWIGETGRWIKTQGTDHLAVALYLITCPSASMIGLYYLPIVTLAHETGLTPETARAVLRRLSEAPAPEGCHSFEGGFAWYDDASEVVWVPQMARYQLGDRLAAGDNKVKGIQREAERWRKSPFFAAFYALYNDQFKLHLAPPEPIRSGPPEGPSVPLPRAERRPDPAAKAPSKGSGEASPAAPSPLQAPSKGLPGPSQDHLKPLGSIETEIKTEIETETLCAEPSGPRPVGPARHPLSQARPRPPQPPRAVARAAKDPEPAATTPIWNAYADAYERRYGVRPDRTYQCNITLQRILDRLPAEIAPQVAAFYVASPEAYYVQLKHPLELLEKQSQKVLTEWKTKTHGSATKAREAERTASNAAALYARELERKEGLP